MGWGALEIGSFLSGQLKYSFTSVCKMFLLYLLCLNNYNYKLFIAEYPACLHRSPHALGWLPSDYSVCLAIVTDVTHTYGGGDGLQY